MDKSINGSDRSKRLVEKAREMLALQETCKLPIENSVDLDLAILPVCIALENGNFQEISATSQAATTSRSDSFSEGIITLTNHTSQLATLDADILNYIDFNHSKENGMDINLKTSLRDSEIVNSSNTKFEHNYAIVGHNEYRDDTLLSSFCVDDNYIDLSSPNLLGENGNGVEAQFVTDIAITNCLNAIMEDNIEQQCTSNNVSSKDAEKSVMEETEENMNKECDKEQQCASNNVSSNDVEEMVMDEAEERMNEKCDQDASGVENHNVDPILHNVENRLSRKPWSWNRNIQKSKRERGRAYKGMKKNPVSGIYEYSQQKEPKKMKPPCECKMSAGNTKLKCRMVVEPERKNIFKHFWRKLDWNEKKMYVVTWKKYY